MTEEKLPQKPSREPQALSSEYHKARKQLLLWAGILFIWELVGIDLEKAKEAGGNAGAIIGSIKSPQAVPWALLILVLYFAFKLRVEWGQCNLARRNVRESRLDYLSAFIVAGAACVLYFGQTISHIQFANAVQEPSRLNSFVIGAMPAGTTSIYAYFWLRNTMHKKARYDLVFFAIAYMSVGVIGSLILVHRGRAQWSYLLLGAGSAFLIFAPFVYLAARRSYASKTI